MNKKTVNKVDNKHNYVFIKVSEDAHNSEFRDYDMCLSDADVKTLNKILLNPLNKAELKK